MINLKPDEKLKSVDALTIGVGWTGSLVAESLTAAGLNVLGLERGRSRYTVPDFQAPLIHDELRYGIRFGMMQDNTKEPLTQRSTPDDDALPMRRWGAFLPGTGLGGSGAHWGGQTWRLNAEEFRLKSNMEERYGKTFVDPALSIQDWGITWEEIEPYYAKFEALCGTSGQAGNIKGKIIPGGNPFEGPRSGPYPTPPMKQPYTDALFAKAAAALGYHPFIQPSSNLSQAYTNPHGLRLNPCMYCGFCERFACEHFAKASAQTTILPVLLKRPNYELRVGCQVLKINLDSTGKRATGVIYADQNGRLFEQPADIVVCSAFAFNNPRMLLLSGIGEPYDPRTRKGVVGRNYAYQTMSHANVFWDEKIITNPFMGAGASGTVIADLTPTVLDVGRLGFIGGSYIIGGTTNGRPIQFHPTPPGTPKWGRQWKEAVIKSYNHTGHIEANGSSMPTWTNYLDLDPAYKDAWGLPALRMTFKFPDNDLKMAAHSHARMMDIARTMGGYTVGEKVFGNPFNITEYQTTHNTGGAIMGVDPRSSVVNKYMQTWDVHNVFVFGSAVFPHNSSYNPTNTIGALTLHALDRIKAEYLKKPGPLVPA